MKKDKGDDPAKKIPQDFEEFARSNPCKELLEAMLDYNKELFRLENKQQVQRQLLRPKELEQLRKVSMVLGRWLL